MGSPLMESEKGAIHIPCDLFVNPINVILFAELKQELVWTKDNKWEGNGEFPGSIEGCINRMVVMGFLGDDMPY